MQYESVNASRIVFFGDADHGKSTLMGYIFAESQEIDIAEHMEEMREELGSGFKPDYCYSSLINSRNPDDTKQKYRTRSCHYRDFRMPDDDGYPLIIMMIDTPGQTGSSFSRSLPNQEYGVANGDIGIFCVEAKKIVDEEDPEAVFRRIKMWLAFHPDRPKRRYVIALTKFDQLNYDERYYRECCEKIEEYLEPKDIIAVIPTAIDVNRQEGHNIFSLSEEMPWYTGSCLRDAIREQNFDISNNEGMVPGAARRKTVFSVKKEIPTPKSGAGKIWKIIVENGTLGIGDRIRLVNVSLADGDGSQTFAEANVKNLIVETSLATDEDEDDMTSARRGQSASIDLRYCHADGKKIQKKSIRTSAFTVGFGENVAYSLFDELFIRFRNAEDVLTARSEKQEVILYYFGKPIPVNITELSEEGIRVRPVSGRSLAFPDDEIMRGLPIFRNTVVRIPTEHDVFEYLPARFDLALSEQKK